MGARRREDGELAVVFWALADSNSPLCVASFSCRQNEPTMALYAFPQSLPYMVPVDYGPKSARIGDVDESMTVSQRISTSEYCKYV